MALFNSYADALAHCDEDEIPERYGRYWKIVPKE